MSLVGWAPKGIHHMQTVQRNRASRWAAAHDRGNFNIPHSSMPRIPIPLAQPHRGGRLSSGDLRDIIYYPLHTNRRS